MALQRRMAFSAFARKWIIVAVIAVVVVVIALLTIIFKNKAVVDDFVDKADQERRITAEKVLDDFVDRRVKEDMPDIKRGIRAMYQSMFDSMREQFADKEKEIAELEDRISEDEKCIKEAEKRGDKASKDAIEYGLTSVKYQLKLAQERKAELAKSISDYEKRLKKMDGEIRHADEELLKLKEQK